MTLVEDARETAYSIISDISNSEDATAEDKNKDPETRKFSRLAAAAAARLSYKILKA